MASMLDPIVPITRAHWLSHSLGRGHAASWPEHSLIARYHKHEFPFQTQFISTPYLVRPNGRVCSTRIKTPPSASPLSLHPSSPPPFTSPALFLIHVSRAPCTFPQSPTFNAWRHIKTSQKYVSTPSLVVRNLTLVCGSITRNTSSSDPRQPRHFLNKQRPSFWTLPSATVKKLRWPTITHTVTLMACTRNLFVDFNTASLPDKTTPAGRLPLDSSSLPEFVSFPVSCLALVLHRLGLRLGLCWLLSLVFLCRDHSGCLSSTHGRLDGLGCST